MFVFRNLKICKLKFIVPSAAIILIIYIYSFIFAEAKPWYYFPAQCKYSEEEVNSTINLAKIIDETLTLYDIDHFLCYGSLWGVLRREQLLPWDNDVDYCILNPTSDRKLNSVKHAFENAGVNLKYDDDEGVYILSKENGHARLIMFNLLADFTSLTRSGKKYIKNKKSITFPSSLIAPPLPRKKFYTLRLPVPRGDIEIQKFFYPSDWWLEIKPPGC